MTSEAARARVDDRTLIRGGKLLAGTAVAVTVLSLGLIIALGEWHLLPDTAAGHLSLWAIGLGSLAWVTIGAQPRNGVVWTLAWAAFFAASATAGIAVFSLTAPAPILELPFTEVMDLSPSALPVAAATALNPVVWVFFPAFFLVLTFGLLLFPDGHPPSPRWRWVGWLSAVIIVLIVPGSVWLYRPWSTTLYSAEPGGAYGVALPLLVLLSVVASVAAIVVRYRRSSGVTRHQIRWIAWGGGFLAASMFVLVVNAEITGAGGFILPLLAAAEVVVILSFWVAITKYRLYDIDVVISKTVTYGALAVFITVLYVAIVVGVGTLVGQGGEPNLALAIAAM